MSLDPTAMPGARAEALKVLLPLKDATVLAIGAGGEALAKWLLDEGAALVVAAVPAGGADAGDALRVAGEAAALPFPAGTFDFVLSDEIAGQATVLDEAVRCLKPGGELVLLDAAQPVMAKIAGAVQTGDATGWPVRWRRERPLETNWRHAVSRADRDACLALRRVVFVEEQGVPLDEEYDADDAVLPMLLAVVDGEPAATLRWRIKPDGSAKIQRVATARRRRGHGLGSLLMRALLEELDAQGVRHSVLDAQTQAQAFYGRLGFIAEGQPFKDAGIWHISMARGSLSNGGNDRAQERGPMQPAIIPAP